VNRDLLGHHSVRLAENPSAPSSLTSAMQRLHKKENLLPKLLHKTDFAAFSGSKNGEDEPPLTGSFERCYVPEVTLLAGVAKLAYAADSKWEMCDFCPLRNSSQPSDPAKENDLDWLKPFAGLLGNS